MDHVDVQMRAGTAVAERYRLDRPLGVGGSGEVWAATDERLGRAVAVKMLRPDVDPTWARLIEREARRAASLSITSIPTVHDVGEHDGRPFVVMELVRGESLAERVRRQGSLDAIEIRSVLVAASLALADLHEAGLVHRDVTPGNLIVADDGSVTLTDLGIAQPAASAEPVTAFVSSLGTVQYVAPEQALGEPVGPAADVYALGVVGYELLAGRRPFEGTPAAVLVAHVHDEPPPLPDTAPADLAAVVMACLSKRPLDRPASARDVAARLQADEAPTAVLPAPIAGAATSAPATAVMPAGALVARRSRRRPELVVGGFVIGALAFAGLVGAATSGDPLGPTDPTVPPVVTTVPPVTAPPPPTTVPAVAPAPAPAPAPDDDGGRDERKRDKPGRGEGRGDRDDDD